jgi:hypothetical protein
MDAKKKGRDRWHGATLNTPAAPNPTRMKAAIKRGIVALALRGLLSPRLATWLIQRGGLKDA